MAKPTERAIKRKPHAVIMLETEASMVPEVPEEGRDFEWFNTTEAASEFFDQVTKFTKSDTKEHDDVAYLTAEVTDTASMTLGRVKVDPVNDETKAWMKSVKDDISTVYVEVKKADTTKANVKVRPKKRAAAAEVVKKDGSAPIKQEDKADRLKKRLAEKKEMGFVVTKSATSPA